MWDEQERFARVVARHFTWFLALLGVVLAAVSLATGDPEFFFTFLLILAILATFTLAYGVVTVIVGGLLLGVTCGITYGLRWLRNHRIAPAPDSD
jgi:hypothetical protein